MRGDLSDRALVLTCPTIPPANRRTEKDHEAVRIDATPRILAKLLDALVMALARMADFATLAVAAEPALGLEPGAFLRAYDAARADARAVILDASPVAEPIRALLAEQGRWRGTAAGLLTELNRGTPDAASRPRGWPGSARSMADAVRRIAPDLRATGYVVEQGPGRRQGKREKERLITLGRDDGGTQPGRTRDAAENLQTPESMGFGTHGTHGTQVSLLGSDA